jgi:hypothetical protein
MASLAAPLPLAPRTNNPAGRPSAKKLAERLDASRRRNVDLVAERRSLLDEVARLGAELVALSRRIELAINAERDDVALHVAGRLEDLGHACQRRGGVA